VLHYPVCAQTKTHTAPAWPSVTVEHFGTNKGLSQSMVKGLAVDKYGYIWLATKDGLNRYDGLSFKVYRNIPGDTTSLVTNFLTRICPDTAGRIWIATINGDVECFDPATGIFHHIIKGFHGLPRSESYYISRIHPDCFGNIIVRSSKWLKAIKVKDTRLSVSKSNVVVKPLSDAYSFIQQFKKIDTSRIIDVICAADSQLAVFMSDSLAVFSKDNIVHGTSPVVISHENGRVVFTDYSPDRKNTITIFRNNMLELFNPVQRKFVPMVALDNTFSDAAYCTDADGSSWLITGGYLLHINPVTKTVDTALLNWQNVTQHYRRSPDNLIADDNGNLWISTTGFGFYKLNTKQLRFRPHFNQYEEAHNLYGDDKSVRVITEGNNRLYDAGVVGKWYAMLQDYYRGSRKKIRPGADVSYSRKTNSFWFYGNPSDYDRDFFLVKSSLGNDKITHTPVVEMMLSEHVLPGAIIISNTGGLWMAATAKFDTGRNYLYHYNDTTATLERYAFPGKQDYLGYKFVADWYQEPGGLFWFGTSQGVYSFHEETKKWKYYKNDIALEYDQSAAAVLSVCPDPVDDNYVWAGTHGSGLYRLNKQTGEYKQFTTGDGLPNDVIYGIMSDEHGNLWIGTNNGLCMFNPRTFGTRSFTSDHGLPDNEFNRYSYSKDTAGNMYWSNVGGYVRFHPGDFYKDTMPSRVVINKLVLNNEEVLYKETKGKKRDDGFVLPAPIEFCDELVVPHGINMFTLGFAVLDLSIPSMNQYKYILEGFNEDWVEAGTKHEATFTNLSPGNYTFKVLGCNSEHIWSEEPAIMHIRILPPWWGTWWFKGLLALLLAGIIYAIYRIRLYQLLHVERMRNDIAQDLHDEIGSTLSSTALYMTVIQKTSQTLPPNTSVLIDKVAGNTSDMMEKMNDIVWATKTDNDSLQKVINRMRAFAVSTTEAKGIVLNFTTDIAYDQFKMTMQQRKNIYLLFKESINNAVKHSHCRSINVNIRASRSIFDMKIIDDGSGFNKEATMLNEDSMSGNGLNSMQQRAAQIGAELKIYSTEGIGTTVLLVLNTR
jgi:ligand-binding sensor domain-containing protein/anti-sigma regulatory factor (Ser/Thr protein kinase)